jgi:hypothetical protein
MHMTSNVARTADPTMRRSQAVLAAFLLVSLSACGATSSDSATVSTGIESASDVDADLAGCGSVAVDDADLAGAQFAFVGRVSAVADEVHPWTTDPENPDRPDVVTTTKWVTFDVERWYGPDWGLTFPVWMPHISVSPGQRVAVGGNA